MNLPLPAPVEWRPRLARESDTPALAVLIPLSVRELQADTYTPAQRETAIETSLFGIDRQLIRDGTYFVVEHDREDSRLRWVEQTPVEVWRRRPSNCA